MRQNNAILLTLLLTACSMFSITIYGQRSTFFQYHFKLFSGSKNLEITNHTQNYKVKSILPITETDRKITGDKFFNYGLYWGYHPKQWQIIEPEIPPRKSVWIQLVKLDSKDTMNIFINTRQFDITNKFMEVGRQIDSIVFTKGNYKILHNVSTNDWTLIKTSTRIQQIYALNQYEAYIKAVQ